MQQRLWYSRASQQRPTMKGSVMKFPLEHLKGCTPLNPCASCQAMKLIRGHLNNAEMETFMQLVRRAYESRQESETLMSSSLEDAFDFTSRTLNALKNFGITTVGELVSKTEVELLLLPNFGRKSLNEIKEALFEHEIFLKTG